MTKQADRLEKYTKNLKMTKKYMRSEMNIWISQSSNYFKLYLKNIISNLFVVVVPWNGRNDIYCFFNSSYFLLFLFYSLSP